MIWLLPLAVALPLVLAAFAVHRWGWWAPAVGAVPALAAALLVPNGVSLDLPWLLLGTRFGLDEIGRIFLIFTSILWIAAGIYAVASLRGTRQVGRFNCFFLLAMAGNLLLITGQDLVSFYLGFALMGISSYGLVIHDGDRAALRAGKTYLVLTLGAELALFAALVMIASTTGSIHPSREDLVALDDLTIGLLVLGFAVKAGLVPLHVWLPLAHPAAPIPASAVLSGAMIKVALLGWLRFLPVGEVALPGWGLLFVCVGLATSLYAVPIGLVQSNPKVLLAYSSVAKMGLMVITIGLMLIEPDLMPVAAIGLALYAGHHALTKGGLFLGVGLRKSAGAQSLVLGGLVLLALSMAAVPLTSGAVAKYGIKPAIAEVDWAWLKVAIALTTIATALMMARFLWMMWRLKRSHPENKTVRDRMNWAIVGWLPLLGLVILYPLLLGSPSAWITDVQLIALAVLLALPVIAVALHRPALVAPLIDSIKPGDLFGLMRPVLASLRWSLRWSIRAFQQDMARVLDPVSARLIHWAQRPLPSWDQQLTAWPVAGALWLGLTVALVGLAMVLPTQRVAIPWHDPDEVARVMQSAAPPSATPPSETMTGEITPAQTVSDKLSPDAPPSGVELVAPISDVPVEDALPTPSAEGSGTASPPDVPAEISDQSVVASNDVGLTTPAPAPLDPTGADAAVADTAMPDEEALGATPGEGLCDPDELYVFRHAPSDAQVQLSRCLSVEGTPRPVEAPPLSNALVLLLQRHLNALGHDSGPEDGFIGRRTHDAIRGFQSERGLAPTGAITFDLLDRLQASQ